MPGRGVAHGVCVPLDDDVARMCASWRFHATAVMSVSLLLRRTGACGCLTASPRESQRAPGRRVGQDGAGVWGGGRTRDRSVKLQMLISPSAPPGECRARVRSFVACP